MCVALCFEKSPWKMGQDDQIKSTGQALPRAKLSTHKATLMHISSEKNHHAPSYTPAPSSWTTAADIEPDGQQPALYAAL